uniref:Uncharacterized protein n=1 Tax=Arundo donax TaxID=35708 RepID=A0A0A9H1K7_ARUDO
MPPGAMGYFSFSSRGSMKNSLVTFSISSSSLSSMPWFTTWKKPHSSQASLSFFSSSSAGSSPTSITGMCP